MNNSEGDKIVFLDLDNTLFDNQGMREKAASQALKCLDLDVPSAEKLDCYKSAYNVSDALMTIGVKDAKRLWHPPIFFAAMMILFSRDRKWLSTMNLTRKRQEQFIQKLQKIQKAIKGLLTEAHFEKRDMLHRELVETRLSPEIHEFLRALNKVAIEERYNLTADEFKKVLLCVLRPQEEVREFLEAIENAGIHFYIVSEGDADHQKEKLKYVGLHENFKDRVLTTESAGKPRGVKQIEERLKLIEQEGQRDTVSLDSNLEWHMLLYFTTLLERFRDKTESRFYARIVHAVLKNGNNPEKSLDDFAYVDFKSWRVRDSARLAMIGDRYEKDVLPLIKLWGRKNVITVRLKFGRYERCFPESRIKVDRRPTATFTHFGEIERYLLDEAAWKRVDPLPWIGHFGIPLHKGNESFIEWALKSDIPLLCKMATILIDERQAYI